MSEEGTVSLDQAMAEADAAMGSAETPATEENAVEAQESVLAEAATDETESPEETEPSEDSGEDGGAESREAWEAQLLEEPLKANGKEIKLDSIDELRKYAQMGISANERWQEAAQIRQLTQEFLGNLKGSPEDSYLTAKKVGMPIDEILELRFQELVQEYQMTPEERALRQRERELEERENDWKRKQDREQQQVREQEIQKIQAGLPAEIDHALKTHGLPDNRSIKLRILSVAKQFSNPEAQYVMPLSHAAQIVKQEITQLYGDLPQTQGQPPGKPRQAAPRQVKPSAPKERHKIRVGSVEFMEDIAKLMKDE